MRKQINRQITYTLATHAAEKMVPSKKALRLCEQIAEGRISADNAVEQIKRNYGFESRRRSG